MPKDQKNKHGHWVLYHTKDEAIQAVRSMKHRDYYVHRRFADELYGDREVMMEVEKNACKDDDSLKYANADIRGDRDIVLQAVRTRGSSLHYASEDLRGDREVVLLAVQQDSWALKYATDDLRGDRQIVMEAVKGYGSALEYALNDARDDREIVLLAVKERWYTNLQYASDRLRGDREIVLLAVKTDGRNLQYASDGLRGDREIVILAIQEYGTLLRYASDDLRGDREVALLAFKRNSDAMEYASDDLKSDADFMLQAMQEKMSALEYVSSSLWSNRYFTMQAVGINGSLLEYASETLRGDREIVEKAVEFILFEQGRCPLQYASEALRGDRKIVEKAVGMTGRALKYASEALRGDRKIVEKAVGMTGLALEYASEALRGDRKIVEKAVQNWGSMLEFAYVGLKADREVVMKAICSDVGSIKFASEELRGDFDFLVEACVASEGRYRYCLPYAADNVDKELKKRIEREAEDLLHIRDDQRRKAKVLDGECKFFFVSRETFLAQATWPKFQDLQKMNLLVEESIRLADGVRGKYSKRILSISHCWETPTVPDPTDTQLKAVQQYLNDHPEFELVMRQRPRTSPSVWGDYCSMPQGYRTPREKLEFKRMLPRINLLYLCTSVVQLVDITYPSRFWTQFESWLAMQLCTPTGLRGAKDARNVRYKIICIHSAEEDYEGAKLQKMWRDATAQVAYNVLSAEDVRVTNLSDKEAQLPKIKMLDEAVIEAFKQPSELPDPVEELDQEVEEVPMEAELTVDWKAEFEKLKEKKQSLEKKNESLNREFAILCKAETVLREGPAGSASSPSACGRAAGVARAGGADIAEQIKNCFRNLDKNGDGAIARRELQILLHRLCRPGQAPTKEQIDRCIEEADKNESGAIEYEEFVDRLMKSGARVQAGRQGAALFDSGACS